MSAIYPANLVPAVALRHAQAVADFDAIVAVFFGQAVSAADEHACSIRP